MKDLKKHLTFIAFLLGLFLLSKILTLEQFQNNESNKLALEQIQGLSSQLQSFYSHNTLNITIGFCIIFFIVTLLYIPFTGSLFVLFAGALFGLTKGIILFSFLVSISYTASFLISRYFFHKTIQKRIGNIGKKIISEFERDGVIYLLSLRFSGVIPAVIVNTAMGITNVSTFKFYLTSQIGTLPHVIMMIYVGTKLSDFTNINDLMPDTFFLFCIGIALLPVIFKIIAELMIFIKNRNSEKNNLQN